MTVKYKTQIIVKNMTGDVTKRYTEDKRTSNIINTSLSGDPIAEMQ